MEMETVKNLVPAAMAMATNAITEYALGKVAIELLDAALPGAFGKFSKFAIKFGISTIYEATIGEKVAASVMKASQVGFRAGEIVTESIQEQILGEENSEET